MPPGVHRCQGVSIMFVLLALGCLCGAAGDPPARNAQVDGLGGRGPGGRRGFAGAAGGKRAREVQDGRGFAGPGGGRRGFASAAGGMRAREAQDGRGFAGPGGDRRGFAGPGGGKRAGGAQDGRGFAGPGGRTRVGGTQDGWQQSGLRNEAGSLPLAQYQPMVWWVLIILVSAAGLCPTPRDGCVRSVLRAFIGLDVRSLALSRILLGAVLAQEATGRFIYAFDFFSDQGLWPRETYLRIDARPFEFCLLAATGNVYFVKALHVVFVVAALLVLVGYQTRVALLVAHFMLVQSVQRNSRICSGGDMMMRMMLLYLHFLPLNVRYSFDALLASSAARRAPQGSASGANTRVEMDRGRHAQSRCRRTEQGRDLELRRGGAGGGEGRRDSGREHVEREWTGSVVTGSVVTGSVVMSCASALYMFNVILVYVDNALWKSGKSWRVDNTAVLRVLQTSQFTSLIGAWVLESLPVSVLHLMSFAAYHIEAYGWLLVACPTCLGQGWPRGAGVMVYMALHLGIWTCMTVGLFPATCMAMWSALLPPAVWRSLPRRLVDWDLEVAPRLWEGARRRWVRGEQCYSRLVARGRAWVRGVEAIVNAAARGAVCVRVDTREEKEKEDDTELELLVSDLKSPCEACPSDFVEAEGPEVTVAAVEAKEEGGGREEEEGREWVRVHGTEGYEADTCLPARERSPSPSPFNMRARSRSRSRSRPLRAPLGAGASGEDEGQDEEGGRGTEDDAVYWQVQCRPHNVCEAEYEGQSMWWRRRALQVLITALAVVSMSTVPHAHFRRMGKGRGIPPAFDALLALLRMEQLWSMFAPQPPERSFWIQMPAVLRGDLTPKRNATKASLNLMAAGGPIRRDWILDLHKRHSDYLPFQYPPQERQAVLYANARWMKLLGNLIDGKAQDTDALLRSYAQYACRAWNSDLAPQDPGRLAVFDVIFWFRRVTDTGVLSPSERRQQLWRQWCVPPEFQIELPDVLPGAPSSYVAAQLPSGTRQPSFVEKGIQSGGV